MRKARTNDHWRRVYSAQYPVRLDSILFSALSGILDDAVRFSGGITAICGQNGVGKSTLMESVFSLFSGDTSQRQSALGKSPSMVIEGTVISGGTVTNGFALRCQDGAITSSEQPVAVSARWLEMSRMSGEIFQKIRGDTNFYDLIVPVEPKTLGDADLAEVSGLVGKIYERVEVYEVDDYLEEVMPFFKVRAGGVEYDSSRMGQGELAIFCGWWFVRFQVEARSLLFVEEPENLLSPSSQMAFVNFLAKESERRKLWTIITTHSNHVLLNVPNEHIRVLVPSPGSARISSVPHVRRYLEQLGLENNRSGFIFVEDTAARDFVKFLIRQTQSWLFADFHIVSSNSEGVVVELLRRFPDNDEDHAFRIIGVLDRDQFGRYAPEDFSWPLLFLPGSADPAIDLKNAAYDQMEGIASRVGASLERVNEVFAASRVVDAHDWFGHTGRLLEIDPSILFNAAAYLWFGQPDNALNARMFVATLEGAFSCSVLEGRRAR